MISSTSLPVSATECTASASIDADPVNTNATNFITAMPRLAASAAKTALIYSIRACRSVIAAAWPGSIPDAIPRYTLA